MLASSKTILIILHWPVKAPKPSVKAYAAFKRNSTIRKISFSNEKTIQYQNTTIALFLFTATSTTPK